MNLLLLIITIQAIILKYKRVEIDRELFAYILISFIANIGMRFNFTYFSYGASKIVFFNLVILTMLFVKNNKYLNIGLINLLIIFLIILLSYFDTEFEGTTYVFGITLLYYLKEVLIEVKMNFSKNILRILILITFTYNLFFLGLSNHPDLWINSQASHFILCLFLLHLIFLYLLIFYSHAKPKY